MRWLMSALALLVCACVAQTAQSAAPMPTADLPAPTPPGATLHIGASNNGQTIEVGVGQVFAVELIGVPTSGYLWGPTRTPGFLTAAGEAGGDTSTAQRQPGFAGGNHWEVFLFRAGAAGRGELVLEQRRPWETGQPAAATFRVTIVAR